LYLPPINQSLEISQTALNLLERHVIENVLSTNLLPTTQQMQDLLACAATACNYVNGKFFS
jgi:hypothetical protein